MKLFFGCLILLLGLKAWALEYTTTVYQVDRGEEGETPLILLGNGQVARLNKHSLHLFEDLKKISDEGDWIEITLNEAHEIVSLQSAEAPVFEEENEGGNKEILYTPSVIPSSRHALAIFKNLNRRYNSESQCYNRAHVWSWEMYQKYHIRSMKVFVFFTPKYIRRYNFEWWFHVAPFIHVREENGTVERVMDYRYSKHPTTMRQWTDTFMHNDAECPVIQKYTDYEYTRSKPEAPWCMLLKVPMYYYQPLDLESLDKENKHRDFWQEWEVGNAYREAFSYRTGN